MNKFLPALLAALLAPAAAWADHVVTDTYPYPGNPAENFAPNLVVDPSYKNLALHRQAYASSSWDYNLTAQLATNGVISAGQPAYFVLSTSRGLVPRVEREWMFDLKTNTSNTLRGTDDYVQLDLCNYQLDFDKLQLACRVKPGEKQEVYYGVPGQEAGAIDPKLMEQQEKREISWSVELQGSTDGQTWRTLDKVEGRGETIYETLEKEGNYGHYRLVFSSPQADSWTVSDCDFFHKGDVVERINGTRTEIHRRDKAIIVSPPFSSAWMSSGEECPWIYVDLGTRASVDRVRLHWRGDAPKGMLQTSDDAQTWLDVCPLQPEMQFAAVARYVRLQIEGADQSCMLSEFEVFGTDGLKAQPKAEPTATDSRMDLAGGNWRLTPEWSATSDGRKLSSAGYDDSSWIVATVPATVLSSYINVGAVPDPNYSDNQLQISESYFLRDFWYRDSFTVPASFAGKKVFLNFDGINWKAEVYLNGQHVGNVDGAFMRGQFDVTRYLASGENHLAVKIIQSSLPGFIKEQTAESTGSNGGVLGADNPTFHASVGWDWIPTIRGRNIGIWNDVYLTATGDVRITAPFVRTELNLPDTTVATVYVETTVSNLSDKPVRGQLKGNFGDTAFGCKVQLAAGESRLVRLEPFSIKHPRLWWPVGYGSPELYDTRIAFEIDGSKSKGKSRTSDEVHFKSGVRQMTYATDSLGALNLYVNGRRFVGKGGNWGFSESNLNYRGREYDIAVRYHAAQNFTMIRNWVGQVGDEEFYEACDRHGVMVWQDFWLANPWDGPDPYDEDMFMANAEDYVKRIRNHASVGLYCGRNEGMPPASLDDALRQLVTNEHPGLHYISHSAADEVSGGGPYRALPPSKYFDLPGANRFHSERGMPCVMNYENLAKTLPADRVFPHNSLWGMHDFTLLCAQYGSTFNELLRQGFGDFNDIGDVRNYCKFAQWINYDGYRAMFEGRSKHRQGLLLWMSHPAWPSLVWQTYDYFFEPTAAYFGCKKACEPLHVQYNRMTGRAEVVNTSAGDHTALTVVSQVLDITGRVVTEASQRIASADDSTLECMTVSVPEDISETYFVRLRLLDAERIVSENFYWMGREEGNFQALRRLPQAKVEATTTIEAGDEYVATTTITNTDDVPALMLRVKLMADDGELILPVLYSDNYISLMPGESRTITTRFSSFDLSGRKPSIVVE